MNFERDDLMDNEWDEDEYGGENDNKDERMIDDGMDYEYEEEEEETIGELMNKQGKMIIEGSVQDLLELYAWLKKNTYKETSLFDGNSGENVKLRLHCLYQELWIETEKFTIEMAEKDLFKVLEKISSAIVKQNNNPRDIEYIITIDKDFLTLYIDELRMKERIPILYKSKEVR